MSKKNIIEKASIITQKTGLDTADLDGEAVMMNMEKGKYYNFNTVGSRIWQLIEKPVSVKEVVDELLKEFDVDEKSCEIAVISFVNRLIEDELIEVS